MYVSSASPPAHSSRLATHFAGHARTHFPQAAAVTPSAQSASCSGASPPCTAGVATGTTRSSAPSAAPSSRTRPIIPHARSSPSPSPRIASRTARSRHSSRSSETRPRSRVRAPAPGPARAHSVAQPPPRARATSLSRGGRPARPTWTGRTGTGQFSCFARLRT